MSTPRHELRPPARIGRDREDAVVRQRLRAVSRSGRPALAWQPATGALARVDPRAEHPVADDGVPWPAVLGPPGTPGAWGDVGPQGEPGALTRDDVAGVGAARAPDGEAGWLPARPGDGERGPVREAAGRPVPVEATGTTAESTPGTSVDDAVGRMRRRAAETAASAYSAAHGHPTAHSGFAGLVDEGRPRWALRPRTAVVAVVVVLALAAGVVALQLPSGGIEPVAQVGGEAPGSPQAVVGDDGAGADPGGASTASGAVADDPAAAEGTAGVVVHVVGQVAAPGLVTVPADARVADALDAAGGATPEADLAALNLARTVTDGEQIVVPRPGEAVPAPDAGGPAAASGAGAAADGVVDLNSADAAALDALPGIGPVLAERIVAWREENGPFTSVDELGEVSGIGPAVLADVRDLVRV